MAGTDSTRAAASGDGPAVVLVEPQLGENIGMVARAMLNFGLTDLRLVRPREPWPNEKAVAASAGADRVSTPPACSTPRPAPSPICRGFTQPPPAPGT